MKRSLPILVFQNFHKSTEFSKLKLYTVTKIKKRFMNSWYYFNMYLRNKYYTLTVLFDMDDVINKILALVFNQSFMTFEIIVSLCLNYFIYAYKMFYIHIYIPIDSIR